MLSLDAFATAHMRLGSDGGASALPGTPSRNRVRGPTSKGKGVKERGREKEGEGNGGGREN